MAYGNLGNVLRDQGDYRGAEEQYRKAFTVDATFINGYTALAFMLFSLENKPTQAIQVLQQGLVANPGDGILVGLLEQYSIE